MSEEGVEHIIMKDLRPGRFIVIDGEPCKVLNIDTSAPGKHGAAKMRLTAIGIFDLKKKQIIKPADAYADAPIITKKRAQVISITGNTAQLMDSDSYEVFDLPVPEDLKDSVNAGGNVEIIETMGRKFIAKALSET